MKHHVTVPLKSGCSVTVPCLGVYVQYDKQSDEFTLRNMYTGQCVGAVDKKHANAIMRALTE